MLATQHLGPFSTGYLGPNKNECKLARRAIWRENSLRGEQKPKDQQESLKIMVARKLDLVAAAGAAKVIGSPQQPPREPLPLPLAPKQASESNVDELQGEKSLRERQPAPVEKDHEDKYKIELVWANIIALALLHLSIPLGFYLLYAERPWKTFAFMIASIYMSALGITGGAHRLWSHRSYKASGPLQVLFIVLQSLAGQNSAYTWARDHRVHHKYSETDADPHNIERGLFFAHMGWLCCKKHPDVSEKGKQIDMSDLESNPYVMFQHRHFWWLSLVFAVLVPTLVPVICWGERLWTSFVFGFMVRYVVSLHATWLVNSVAHHHGARPYDTSIRSCEATALLYTGIGESSHNYHHTFPYDYAASELGRYFNLTTIFIDLCADLGLVTGRRRVSAETLLRRRRRTGDLADALGPASTPEEEDEDLKSF